MISAPIWDNESLAHLLASNANHLYPFTKPSRKCRKNQARNKYKNLGPNREKSELPECENKRFSKWKVTPSCLFHLHFTSTVSLSHGAQDRHGRNLYLPSDSVIPSAVLGRGQTPSKGLQAHSGEEAQASFCHIQNESSWDIREHKSTVIKTFLYYMFKVHSKTTKGVNVSG